MGIVPPLATSTLIVPHAASDRRRVITTVTKTHQGFIFYFQGATENFPTPGTRRLTERIKSAREIKKGSVGIAGYKEEG